MRFFRSWFSCSRFSTYPLDVARPVIRSVVRHSVLFCKQGEHPPGNPSHRILRTYVKTMSASLTYLQSWCYQDTRLLTLHRSQACPVRVDDASLFFTEFEKSSGPKYSV